MKYTYDSLINNINSTDSCHAAEAMLTMLTIEEKRCHERAEALRLQIGRFKRVPDNTRRKLVTTDEHGVDEKTKVLITNALSAMGKKYEVIATQRNRFKIYEVA